MRFLYAALFTLFTLANIPIAQAEYRVFELAITETATNTTRTVISTLDDIQYPGYFPLKANETISIQDTWMCWGRHGKHVKHCPNPRTSTID